MASLSAGDPNAIPTRFGRFTVSPAAGVPRIPRNVGDGPELFTTDLAISRAFQLRAAGTTGGATRGTVGVTSTNLTNHVHFAPFNGVIASPFFGRANRALNPRRITFGAQIDF